MPAISGTTAALIGAGIAGGSGIASSVIGSKAQKKAAAEARKLTPEQQQIYNRLLKQLNTPASAKPQDIARFLNQANLIGQGATARSTKNFVGKGLGQSGLFGQSLSNIQTNLIPQLQLGGFQRAEDLAQGLRQQEIGNLIGALGGVAPQFAPSGESPLGAGLGSLGQTLAFLLGIGAFGGKGSVPSGGGMGGIFGGLGT